MRTDVQAHVCFRTNRPDLMELRRIVSQNPNVHSGDLVFAGTRVPVRHLVAYLKGGDSLDVFLEHFPTVERRQAEAFLEETEHDMEKRLNQEGPRADSASAR